MDTWDAPARLTLDKVVVRVIQAPLRRPIVAKIGEFKSWPFILTDVLTKEGVVGHSYLEGYRVSSAKSIVALIDEMAEQQRGKPVAPFDRFDEAMRSLHLLGRQGVTLFAFGAGHGHVGRPGESGRAALGALLGGTVGPVRAYNTNGLWLVPVERLADEASSLVAEGGFRALKIRLGRDNVKDDLKAIAEVRRAVGDDIVLMSDFNQGLSFNAALRRLHAARPSGSGMVRRAHRVRRFRGLRAACNELKTPLQIGENIYGPRHFLQAVQRARRIATCRTWGGSEASRAG